MRQYPSSTMEAIQMPYDLTQLQAPRSAGGLLRFLTSLAEGRLLGGVLARKFLRDVGVDTMRATPAVEAPWEPFLGFPEPPALLDAGPGDASKLAPGPAEQSDDFPFETSSAFVAAYRDGRRTPLEVAERVLSWSRDADALTPPMRVFIAQQRDDVLAQARASTERWKAGRPLGPLDGVPLAVKDELDQQGYPRTVGTRVLGDGPAAADAGSVARLRAAGAILIGKANMHELGMGVTGLNPHHGPARNPYDPARATGGSSSGPAAAVASGLCPVALGADGGGSIRIPASLCGLVGLKPTFGRVSERGAAPLCWSVAHIGPIAASVRDVAISYLALAGPDAGDPHTQRQPPPAVEGWDAGNLQGVRLGVCTPWLEHADRPIVAACRAALDAFREAGASIVEVDVPELALLRTVHMVTIASEMQASQLAGWKERRKRIGYDIRLNMAITRHATSGDYIHAQRHRARFCRQWAELLGRVDAIVTPATACTAPLLRPDALRTGDSDLATGDRIMRNSLPANLTGQPAISFPVGYDPAAMPIGMQAVARAWNEALLLRIAFVAERAFPRRPPKVHRRMLDA